MDALTPREIVQELDKYIVGQDNAKRAVAIALRNRWRRHVVGTKRNTPFGFASSGSDGSEGAPAGSTSEGVRPLAHTRRSARRR